MFEEFGEKRVSGRDLGLKALYEIAQLPPDQREQPHTVPSTGEAIFEIGKRLKSVRDNPQKYGFEGFRDWGEWCHEKLDMSRRNANRFIKVFDRFAEKPGTPVSRLPNSMSVLYALTDFNDDELEKPREMSDGSTKKLTEMSRREIEEFKAREKKAVEEKEKALLVAEEAEEARKQAEAQRDMALMDSDILRDTLESMADVEPEVRTEYPDFFA